MDILDHEDMRSCAGQGLEQPAERRQRLLRRPVDVDEPKRRRDAVGDERTVILTMHQRTERLTGVIPSCLTNHLAERPQRDPLPVGQAAADQSGCPVRHFGGESHHQP